VGNASGEFSQMSVVSRRADFINYSTTRPPPLRATQTRASATGNHRRVSVVPANPCPDNIFLFHLPSVGLPADEANYPSYNRMINRNYYFFFSFYFYPDR